MYILNKEWQKEETRCKTSLLVRLVLVTAFFRDHIFVLHVCVIDDNIFKVTSNVMSDYKCVFVKDTLKG